ncbi:unnamed protein product [Arctogadus glacialis]
MFSLLSRSRFSRLPGRLLFALYYLGTPRHALPGSSKEGGTATLTLHYLSAFPKRRENNVFRGAPRRHASKQKRFVLCVGPRRAADDLTAHGARGG